MLTSAYGSFSLTTRKINTTLANQLSHYFNSPIQVDVAHTRLDICLRTRQPRFASRFRLYSSSPYQGPHCQMAAEIHLLLMALRDAPTGSTFNNCTLCPHCIYVFCIYLRTNSDSCHLQHKLIGFYNRDEKCLQRGTDWVFK